MIRSVSGLDATRLLFGRRFVLWLSQIIGNRRSSPTSAGELRSEEPITVKFYFVVSKETALDPRLLKHKVFSTYGSVCEPFAIPSSKARYRRTISKDRELFWELGLTDRLTAYVAPGLSPASHYYDLAVNLGNMRSSVLFLFEYMYLEKPAGALSKTARPSAGRTTYAGPVGAKHSQTRDIARNPSYDHRGEPWCLGGFATD